MLRKLLIVFASGVILSIAAFSLAFAIGGDDIRRGFDNGGWTFITDDEDELSGARKTRIFALASGSRLAMEVPVDLEFDRGDKAEMRVEGPSELVDRLVWQDGRLSLKGSARLSRGLKVRITAPEIGGLDLDAPGEVNLRGLRQDELRVNARGAMDLEADGQVPHIFVSSAGAGDIDLGKVQGQDATIRVDGVGDVTIGASGIVDVQINGAGNVTLLRKPATLRSHINGVGSVDHAY
ncbi:MULTISPECIES: GIN domain-containing protein [Novosphingobium]|jgi:hypothetical protein|uniref:Auto-transporter adhesin, head GIN domain n=1 Tax=Novosphingobium panipatense TaxID=428991 RepID=A0ABY1QGB7_9SPHN|nr:MULTISPECIES: DUF2807 domain-containing protein [Novosphingobium]SMP67527.1 Putative auto-transporter adhesin, head GIN domain [Novosphingobium panipatense]